MPSGFSIRSLHKGGEASPLRHALAYAISAMIALSLWIREQKRILGWRRFLLRFFAVACGIFVLYLLLLWLTLPNINDPKSLFAAESSVITDRNGIELYRLFNEQDRTYIPGEQIPRALKQAIVAIEDERFYQHGCVDPRAILRAAFSQFVPGVLIRSGGSTLTQQLARNALLSRERTFTRKFREIMLACKLESTYGKDALLELYLNWIPFGRSAYGVEQASQAYFGVHAKDLSLAKSAVLASLPQRPSYFNPFGAHARTTVSAAVRASIASGRITSADQVPESGIQIGLLGTSFGSGSRVFNLGGRADQVLYNMKEQGFITEDERLRAARELSTMVFKPGRENIRAPHFVLWIREQVEQMLARSSEKGLLEQGGLTIQTTLDWEMQKAAEAVIAAKRGGLRSVYGAGNAALLAADPATGEILAYVGNTGYAETSSGAKVDMVRSPRQPGSSFKPFVYAAAFQQGYGPGTVLYDVPTKFGEDEPQNYEGNFWGLMTVRRALAGSRNIPAIKAFFLAGGEEKILDLARTLGVTTPGERRAELSRERNGFAYGWPLGIGAAETPLFEMVQGYATLAGGGRRKALIGIRSITDKAGAILYVADSGKEGEDVLDPRIAYQLTSILSDVNARPNAYWQQILTVPGFQAAAKTGTSNKCLERESLKGVKSGTEALPADAQSTNVGKCKKRKPDNAWTLGYTPNIVAGVWVGNADSRAMSDKSDGLTIAAPIWQEFMVRAHKLLKNPVTMFSVPEGLVQPQISLLSGELPTECTPVPFRAAELFVAEHPPSLADPACVQLKVDKVTGLLASPACPAEAEEQRSFLVPHSVLADRWPLWERGVQEWVQKYNGSGARLPLPLAPTEECDARRTPWRLVLPTLQIIFPRDGGGAGYPSFQPDVQFTVGSGTTMSVAFKVDGRALATGTARPFAPVLRMPQSLPKEGTHELSITLTDAAFNTATQSVHFHFEEDRAAPQVFLRIPQSNTTFKTSDDLSVTADASDPQGGIRYVEFFLDETLLARDSTEPYEVRYPLKETPPGEHRLRAKATDLAGNEKEDEVMVTVE